MLLSRRGYSTSDPPHSAPPPSPLKSEPMESWRNLLLVSNVELTPTYKSWMKEKFICDIFRDICSSMVYLINKKNIGRFKRLLKFIVGQPIRDSCSIFWSSLLSELHNGTMTPFTKCPRMYLNAGGWCLMDAFCWAATEFLTEESSACMMSVLLKMDKHVSSPSVQTIVCYSSL